MNSLLRRCLVWSLLAGAVLTTVTPVAQAFGRRYHRQYYTGWTYHPQGGYHYRYCCYQPTPSYVGYRYHYVVYQPSQPQYLYYYNPYTQVFWGRSSIDPERNPGYSLLPESQRKGRIEEIPESAFGELTKVPTIPESNDGTPLELPPAGPPAEFTRR
jgi:hypothetical protein